MPLILYSSQKHLGGITYTINTVEDQNTVKELLEKYDISIQNRRVPYYLAIKEDGLITTSKTIENSEITYHGDITNLEDDLILSKQNKDNATHAFCDVIYRSRIPYYLCTDKRQFAFINDSWVLRYSTLPEYKLAKL